MNVNTPTFAALLQHVKRAAYMTLLGSGPHSQSKSPVSIRMGLAVVFKRSVGACMDSTSRGVQGI